MLAFVTVCVGNQRFKCIIYVLNLLVYPKVVVGVMYLNERFAGKKVSEGLKKCWFHIALLASFSLPIIVLMFLDYFDIESFHVFNQEFRFLSTWKGRMFYLFFLWILFMESIIDWSKIVEKKPKNRFRIFAFFVCAVIPLIYVLSVNFWGIDQVILDVGEGLGFTDTSLVFHWPLCIEYLVFAFSFLVAIFLAYGKLGLGHFSIALSLLVGMSVIYTINAFESGPGGIFKPFAMLTLPTAACAAALLDILGYSFTLSFRPGLNSMPLIITSSGAAYIGWPCAGVHSLFLFIVIILLFFKRSSISTFRKFIYFVVGTIGTYLVNVLRIVSYFVILENDGASAARFFHNSLGELYFVSWMFSCILIIVSIERFMLVEKARHSVQKLRCFLGNGKDRILNVIRRSKN